MTTILLKPKALFASLAMASLLAACGGGSSSSPPETASPPAGTGDACTTNPSGCTVPSPVLAASESTYTLDKDSVYAVELDRVIQATVVTIDGPYTFADVNADVDDTDAVVPEVDAHLVLENYADDGLTKNAKLRLRGHSTRLAEQKSYRIKLASSAPLWRSESTLQLNKHPYDLTRVRNKLAFDLFRDIPHIASLRTQFVHMNIINKDKNGAIYATADFGLFTHVEKFGKEYLANRMLPTDGNIYKAEAFDFRPSANLAVDASGKVIDKVKFEQVLSLEADNNDHKPLLAMIADVNNEAIPFDTTFAKYFDKNNYLTWLATSILFGNRDTFDQNFGLYQPKGGNTFYFVPWDYDGAFGFEDQPDQLAGGALYAPWQKSIANWWDVPLHKRFLQDPKHLAELKQAIKEIYDAHLTDEKINAKLARYQPLVAPFIARNPDSIYLPTVSASPTNEWSAEFSRIASVIKKNRDTFSATLDAPMPFWQSAELQSNQILLSWDKAVDLQGDSVTYTVQVARTPTFTSLEQQIEVKTGTLILIPKLPNGVFYLRVTARDSKGNIQNAFDRFNAPDGASYFGVSAYTVSDTAVTPFYPR